MILISFSYPACFRSKRYLGILFSVVTKTRQISQLRLMYFETALQRITQSYSFMTFLFLLYLFYLYVDELFIKPIWAMSWDTIGILIWDVIRLVATYSTYTAYLCSGITDFIICLCADRQMLISSVCWSFHCISSRSCLTAKSKEPASLLSQLYIGIRYIHIGSGIVRIMKWKGLSILY